MRLLVFIVMSFVSFKANGQKSNCWTLLLVDKSNELEPKPSMSSFSRTGFYMYRNCVYEIETKDGGSYSGRLIDIKPDTLFITNFLNENVAQKASFTLDTMALHYKQLDKLKLISDRSMTLYVKHSFDKFNFIFKEDSTHCVLQSRWKQIYTNDTASYELVPHLTAQGVNLLFEEAGRTYYYYGSGMTKPDYSKMDHSYTVKNVFWFTPCEVEKINGLAIGLFPNNIKNEMYNEKSSLQINGLNIEINPFSFFTLMNPHFVGLYPDSIKFYNEHLKQDIITRVNGMNISVVSSINETEFNGLNITGLITLVDEIDGVSISGLSNFAYKLNGLSIAAIYNRATQAKGVQIGLINKSANMRGIQIGLWNTNGRRSLPFINWQFKDKK